MEENNEKQEVTEELKSEAASTVNQVKETIKKVDIKKDSVETKGFIKDMFKDPLGTIQEIATKDTTQFFKYAIIILVIWTAIILVKQCFSIGYLGYLNIGNTILSIVKAVLVPVLSILTMSIITFVLNKNNKKSLTTVITAITAAKIPTVLASIISMLTLISNDISKITSPISSFASVISTVLMYFALKAIFGIEKNSDFIKKFALVEIIYYVVYFVLSFLGIHI